MFAKVNKVDYSFGYCAENFDGFSVVRDERGIIHDQKNAFTNGAKQHLAAGIASVRNFFEKLPLIKNGRR